MPRFVVFLIPLIFNLFTFAIAQENNTQVAPAPVKEGVSQFQLDSQISQVQSEIRAQRDLTEIRLNNLENEIRVSASYNERLLFGFMLAGAIVVFVVLFTLNKQSSVNNEKMRNLIREADNALDDLHRLMDRPEAEHFHLSRNLSRIMNKFRERDNPSLPQKDMTDIYAAAEDPTLPVTLHVQANALQNELKGKWEDAIVLWEKLLKLDSANPEVLLHLAQNYKKLSEISGAKSKEKLRLISLDYFQKYSHRTSLHTHSERELRKSGEFKMDLKEDALINKQISDLHQYRQEGLEEVADVTPATYEEKQPAEKPVPTSVPEPQPQPEPAPAPKEEKPKPAAKVEKQPEPVASKPQDTTPEPKPEVTAETKEVEKPKKEVVKEEKEETKKDQAKKKKRKGLTKTLLGFSGKKEKAKEEDTQEDEKLPENQVTAKTTEVESKAKDFIDDILTSQTTKDDKSTTTAKDEKEEPKVVEEKEPEKTQAEIEREEQIKFFAKAKLFNLAEKSLAIKDGIVKKIKAKEEQIKQAEIKKQEAEAKAKAEEEKKKAQKAEIVVENKFEDIKPVSKVKTDAEVKTVTKDVKQIEVEDIPDKEFKPVMKKTEAIEIDTKQDVAKVVNEIAEEQKAKEEQIKQAEIKKQEAAAKAKAEEEKKIAEAKAKAKAEEEKKAAEKAKAEKLAKEKLAKADTPKSDDISPPPNKITETKETIPQKDIKMEENTKDEVKSTPTVQAPKPTTPAPAPVVAKKEEVKVAPKPAAPKPVAVQAKPAVSTPMAKNQKPRVKINQNVQKFVQQSGHEVVDKQAEARAKMSPELIDKAFKSRTDKADDHFRRFMEAKNARDKVQWLQAAADEYKEASRYKTDEHLYKFWGATLLEISNLDVDNTAAHVNKSIELYVEGNAKYENEFINELALCYAKLNLENDCRSTLQLAKEKGLLDTSLVNEQPEYDIYKKKEWFNEFKS